MSEERMKEENVSVTTKAVIRPERILLKTVELLEGEGLLTAGEKVQLLELLDKDGLS